MTDWLSHLLFLLAAFFFLLAAISVASGKVFRADTRIWFYGGLSSLTFGLAAS